MASIIKGSINLDKIDKIKIIINGVGSAGVAIGKLLLLAGAKNIVFVDSKGVIYDGRKGMSNIKMELAKKTNLKCKSKYNSTKT